MLEVEKQGWKTSFCKHCGAHMIWATRTDKNGIIPLDPKAPIFMAKQNEGTRGPTACQATHIENSEYRNLFVSHFATCPVLQRSAKSLKRIREIIESVDNRCAAVDGPVSSTLFEMTTKEIIEIYKLAKGR